MLGLFKIKPDPIYAEVSAWNAETDRVEALYAEAKSIDGITPSIEGNKVVFDDPELESKIESKCEGINFVMHTGSIELDIPNSRKIFKNDSGKIHRIEVFRPMRCRMTCE